MKTTLEIPDPIFRRAKSAATERGIPLRVYVTEAVQEKLDADRKSATKPWMAAFGKLKHLRKETARINRIIEEEFEKIEPRTGFDPRHPCSIRHGGGGHGDGTYTASSPTDCHFGDCVR